MNKLGGEKTINSAAEQIQSNQCRRWLLTRSNDDKKLIETMRFVIAEALRYDLLLHNDAKLLSILSLFCCEIGDSPRIDRPQSSSHAGAGECTALPMAEGTQPGTHTPDFMTENRQLLVSTTIFNVQHVLLLLLLLFGALAVRQTISVLRHTNI